MMTQLNSKVSLLIIVLYGFNFQMYAQIIEKDRTITNDRIVAIYEAKEPKKIVSVFENKEGSIIIKEGPKAGSEYEKISSGILIEGNHHFFLPYESFLFYKEGFIFTVKLDWTTYTKVILKYKIEDNLVLQNKLNIGSIESGIKINKSRNLIIVDDLSEGFGSLFNIISTDLEVLRNYKPFECGFKNSIIDSDSTRLVIITESEEIPSLFKTAFFNYLDGTKTVEYYTFENQFDVGSKVTNIAVPDEGLLILIANQSWPNKTKLLLIDKIGGVIWVYKNSDQSYMPFIYCNNKTAIFNNINNLIAINLETGNEEWKFSFEHYFPNTEVKNIAKVIPLSHTLVFKNSMIGIVMGEIVHANGISNGYSNEKLFLLSWDGILKKLFNYQENAINVNLIDINLNQFILINDKKSYYYEKEN